MPTTVGFPASFLHGLSDFWQRFFADSDQLEAMYRGTAVLVGQAYLDMLSNVLGVSLQDAPVFNKEYFKLVTMREDELRLILGATTDDNRYLFNLPDDVVSVSSFDNRVIEPTVSLETRNDFDLDTDARTVAFRVDPTNPPMTGYAQRQLDVAVGGWFDDSARLSAETWGGTRGVIKGDTLRILDVGPGPLFQQRKRGDYSVVLVRDNALYVSVDTPLASSSAPQNYVVLRRPYNTQVLFEPMTFVGNAAQLANTRLDAGSVRVYAKNNGTGADVVEGVDYTVDYEKGIVYRLTTWAATSSNKVTYTWQQEVWPLVGAAPHYSTTGTIKAGPTTARVVQLAMWAPDVLVDRRVLANNFGALIGVEQPSTESYRAFLRGIFQLYVLGPVLQRIESALNIILGLPVVRTDGEVLQAVDTSQPDVLRVTTSGGVYEFPAGTPMRTDVLDVNQLNVLTFKAFEPLTTAITVTDYIQDPNWWHGVMIPSELFTKTATADIPSPARRVASDELVQHVVGAPDGPCFGDPGLKVGADENGVVPPPGHPIFRHRMAYVLMDWYLKYHTFFIQFAPSIFSNPNAVQYAHTADDLNKLVFSAKPKHTFLIVQPTTAFLDTAIVADEDYYQPQRYAGADANATEIYAAIADFPNGSQPYVQLGLFFTLGVQSPPGQDDQIIGQDSPPAYGVNGWKVGDYFHYEAFSSGVNFPSTGVAVALPNAPAAPRRRRLVHVYVGTTIGGKRLIEGTDYTVDYAAGTVTRLTAWAATTGVSIQYLQLNIGNVTDAPADQTVGDMPLLVGGIDPALVRAAYPTATDWLDNPVTDRDISMVEHPITLTITAAP